MHKVIDENYIDLLVDTSLLNELGKGYTLTKLNDRYSILHYPVSKLSMCHLGYLPYHVFPTLYTLNSAISLQRSGVTSIQDNSNFSLFGRGVLIGFVDTGIDYRHNAFLKSDGTTKIFSIWDQTADGGTPPPEFTFGSEYNQEAINLSLLNNDSFELVPTTDDNGHGTMMAGIAAGSRNQTANFSGVAPESELIVVKLAPAKQANKWIFSIREDALCYPETNIIAGIHYIRAVAERLKRPLILCLGIGSSQSAHDGQSALSWYLNTLGTYSRIAICTSAGNEGNNQRHYHGNMSAGQDPKEIEFSIGATDSRFPLELWQPSPNRLTLELKSPTGQHIPSLNPGFNRCYEQNFVLESTKVYINNFIMEEETGDQLILMRFEHAQAGIWTLRVKNLDSIDSRFNIWMPSGNIITDSTHFLEPDPFITVTSPSNAANAIAVTAYNQLENSILLTSSRGFSTTNTITPDIAAPGYNLSCPLPGQNYGTAAGTGAASAHTAGILALLMEWAVSKGNYTTITGRDLNRLIIRGARRDPFLTYPNPIWGYGKINISGVFESLI